MTPTARRVPPTFARVLRTQVRAMRIALGPVAVLAATLPVLLTVLVISGMRQGLPGLSFQPHHQMLPGVLGLLLPVFVWRGVARFGDTLFLSLPVSRPHHLFARTAAGWCWLMGAVAIFTLWQLLLTLISGGALLADETVRLADGPTLRDVTLPFNPLFWLVPFTAATGTYWIASAFAIATRRPARLLTGLVLGAFLIMAIADFARASVVTDTLIHVASALFAGPYGLDALLTARTESLKGELALPDGHIGVVWRGLPRVTDWAVATLLWLVGGACAFYAATLRHRESR